MDLTEEKVAAISGVDEYEEEEEEVEEIVEEEVVEEEVEEEGGDGKGGIGNVDSAGKEIKQAANGGSSSSSSSSKPGKIFVGGVAWETTEDTFSNYFKKYGDITDSVIMKDKHTQKPRGFGFVTFADPYVIDKVLEDEHVIDGRTVEVKRTVPREDASSKGGSKTKKIFVGGIPPSFTEDELKEHFGSYGNVVEHQIMLDHSTGRSRGFGFVTFESEEAVDKIISEGKMHDLGGKKVEIKKAEPKRAGGDATFTGRAGYGAGVGNFHGFGGGLGGGAYGYGGDYRSGGDYYGGRAGGSYGRGYVYGGPSYGSGFGLGFGAQLYGAGAYGAGNGYGGGYAGYSGGRGYGSRYHPYGR